MRTTKLVLFCTLLLVPRVFAAQPLTLNLWPAKAPGENAVLPPETVDSSDPKRNIAGRSVAIMDNVSTPTLSIFRADPAKATGAAVLVCPGGGYYILAYDLEGTEVAEWLNAQGITAIVLKYRVPRRDPVRPQDAPLQDAQRAMGLVRSHAAEWGIDPRRIGVLGFSAGGNLAAELSNRHATRTYPAVDAIDSLSCRPDFCVLIYPGGLTQRENHDALIDDLKLDPRATPPTFLAMAGDDPVRVENALSYYLGLKKAGVAAELHLYPRGGHGYGLRRTKDPVTTWPDRMIDWLKAEGFGSPSDPPKQP